MNNQPLEEFPQPTEEMGGEPSVKQPNFITIWLERLAHLGLGEISSRVGTNFLAIVMVVAVVLMLQHAKLGGPSPLPATTNLLPVPSSPVSQLPVEIALSLDGIPRQAELHTIIPSRPRIDVTIYTVQTGDSIFKIADNFGLKPTSILFGNYSILKDSPDLLKAGQKLNILPVDGTYYEWQGTESLTKVAEVFGVDTESIINYPGNHLDPDTIGDLSHPNIPAGTWLIVPGGVREFTSWTAPAQLVQDNPSTFVWGPGVCGGISFVQVGYGNFIYPTTEHWLSGTPYRPDLRHFGVDFAGAQGNGVFAADAGTVVYSGWNDWGYGNLVIIDHGNGWQSLYAHLSAINVGCGQNVGQGDTIGLVGMTGGTSTGPHLHFELMNKTLGYVNPLDYMPAP
jgi:murein DD-endopeptidase MepM/ murein hydrolase activator NlpD